MKTFVLNQCGASFTDPADSTFYAGGLQFSDLVESFRMLSVLAEADSAKAAQELVEARAGLIAAMIENYRIDF